MPTYQLAQVNIARAKGPLEGPLMAGFVARLDEINAVAESSPGFIWRLKGESNNALYLRPFDDDRIIFNLSVWESVDALRAFVYKSMHRELLQQRKEWFEHFGAPNFALWWVPAGHVPGIDEAKKRLAHLDAHGPSEFAFTFKNSFPPDDAFQAAIDWSAFKPCPAMS